MIQTALGINGYDCTFCDGNTAEEYEAIAVSAAPDSRGDPQSRRRQGGMPRTGWQSTRFGADPSLWS
jgi:hypothetical protein